MSIPRSLPQSKEALLKSYRTRLKDDVKSMLENFEGKYITEENCNVCLLQNILRNCEVIQGRT